MLHIQMQSIVAQSFT